MPRSVKPVTDRANDMIDAARELFGEKGFENTSVDDIVERVGVAKGLFYYYFDSKEEVIEILHDRLIEEIRASITAAMEKKGLTAMQRFGELLEANRDIASRSLMLMTYFKKERNKAFHLSMEHIAHRLMMDAMEAIIVQGIEEGTFHVIHPRETTIALDSIFRSLCGDLPEEASSEQLERTFVSIRDLTERLLGMEKGTFIIHENLLPPVVRRGARINICREV